ncbi:MAG: glycosyltransferase [Flavobacteriales bacterium]|nr:glycosyltransferase [Flavobacteriales bacterium]
MPKVLRILNRFNLGGPTYNAAYLTKYLAPDFETLLVGGAKNENEETSMHITDRLGLTPLIIPEMKREISPFNDYKAYQTIKKIIKDFRPDIVHTHASKSGLLGRMAASSMQVPVIIHTFHGHVFHSYFGKAKSGIYQKLEKYAAKKSSAIVAISEKQKHELCNIYRICTPEKTHIIPLGFELDKFNTNKGEKRTLFRKRWNIAENEIAIGIVGRLVPVKNHKLFIDAIKIVNEKTTQKTRAFIVGDGELRKELEDYCQSQNITYSNTSQPSSITFTSWLKEIDEVNAGMDIIALTSFNEGTPVSLIEAQAASKPIVSTNVGGIENIVIENETAFLTSSNNKEQFAEKLLLLVESEELRKKMSLKGWDFVYKNYTFQRLANDTQQLYFSLLNRKN